MNHSVETGSEGLTYSLRVSTGDPSGDIYAADWDSREQSWGISTREYGSVVWHKEAGSLEGDKGELVYEAIVGQFGLDLDNFSLEEVAKMHPRSLAELGTQDPRSATMGDRRTASQVGISPVSVAQ